MYVAIPHEGGALASHLAPSPRAADAGPVKVRMVTSDPIRGFRDRVHVAELIASYSD